MTAAGTPPSFVGDPRAARWLDPVSWRRRGRDRRGARPGRRCPHSTATVVPHAASSSSGPSRAAERRPARHGPPALHARAGPPVVRHLSPRTRPRAQSATRSAAAPRPVGEAGTTSGRCLRGRRGGTLVRCTIFGRLRVTAFEQSHKWTEFRRERTCRRLRGRRNGCTAGTCPGQVVQEFGYDDDVDEDLATRSKTPVGGDLEYDDFTNADAVLLWWRDEDGDLADAPSTGPPNLAEGARSSRSPRQDRPRRRSTRRTSRRRPRPRDCTRPARSTPPPTGRDLARAAEVCAPLSLPPSRGP